MSEETKHEGASQNEKRLFSSALIDDAPGNHHGLSITNVLGTVIMLSCFALVPAIDKLQYGSNLLAVALYTILLCIGLFLPGKNSSVPPLDFSSSHVRRRIPLMLRIHILFLGFVVGIKLTIYSAVDKLQHYWLRYTATPLNAKAVFLALCAVILLTEIIYIIRKVDQSRD